VDVVGAALRGAHDHRARPLHPEARRLPLLDRPALREVRLYLHTDWCCACGAEQTRTRVVEEKDFFALRTGRVTRTHDGVEYPNGALIETFWLGVGL
jgi:hypothetical protein